MRWLEATHPDDVEIMFNPNSATFRLTPESTALWERHTIEFVESLKSSG